MHPCVGLSNEVPEVSTPPFSRGELACQVAAMIACRPVTLLVRCTVMAALNELVSGALAGKFWFVLIAWREVRPCVSTYAIILSRMNPLRICMLRPSGLAYNPMPSQHILG